jgi:hypothetical protein
MQASDPHPHLTLFYSIWAAIGPLVGLGFGAWLQARGQHTQWRRDNIRQECRELLGQFSVNLFAFIDWQKSVLLGKVDATPAAVAEYDRAVLDLHRNLGSRLLIATEIKDMRIAARWEAALDRFRKHSDENELNAAYQSVIDDIVTIGLKE